ncbi:transcriptional repressor [Candidatus Saccharibacteria bacterium]|nr:MAG: transcriptional repressor [Candidatus Saccharibacteria bacterium]
MSSQIVFETALKQNNLSLTKPRQAVFEALQHHKSLTMAELVAACPGVNRASVYRTSEVFERLGIIMRIPTGWKYRLELGEAFHEHHHHATCSACGASIALPEDLALEKRLRDLAARRNFTLISHQIELTGHCDACVTPQVYGTGQFI